MEKKCVLEDNTEFVCKYREMMIRFNILKNRYLGVQGQGMIMWGVAEIL